MGLDIIITRQGILMQTQTILKNRATELNKPPKLVFYQLGSRDIVIEEPLITLSYNYL